MPNTNPVVILLAEGMAKNGYSGLITPDSGCRCRIENLVECRGDPSYCEPGHVHVNPKQPTDWTVRRGPVPNIVFTSGHANFLGDDSNTRRFWPIGEQPNPPITSE